MKNKKRQAKSLGKIAKKLPKLYRLGFKSVNQNGTTLDASSSEDESDDEAAVQKIQILPILKNGYKKSSLKLVI